MENNDKWENHFEGAGGKYGYDGPEEYRPLSPWAYFGYSLLFSIPFVGLILLIVFSFMGGNVNRRNFARSFFIGWLVFAILLTVFTVAVVVPAIPQIRDAYRMYGVFKRYI